MLTMCEARTNLCKVISEQVAETFEGQIKIFSSKIPSTVKVGESIQVKSKKDYDEVADEIYRLRELKQNALVENAEREGKRQRIAEMTAYLNEQTCELVEYDEQLVRWLIERVTVHDDRIEVEFKSSIAIDIEN